MMDKSAPGVTVRIVEAGPTPCTPYGFYWEAWLDEVAFRELRICSEVPFPTLEAAEADCREKMALLLARCLGFTGMHPDDVQLNFVRE